MSLPLVVLGLSFQTLQTLFISLAWRNILRAAYPKSVLPYREVLSYYAGGAGLNSILPASAGTVAMLGLYRAAIAGSTVAGLVGATVVQNIFFVVVAALIYLWLFLSVAGSFDVKFGWFADHVGLTLIIVVGGARADLRSSGGSSGSGCTTPGSRPRTAAASSPRRASS